MKWFYIILIAAFVGALAIAVERLTGMFRHPSIQIVVTLSVLTVFVGLVKFLSRLRD